MITVYTTTFNRAHLLDRLYNSLVNQSSKKFEWLIVDDGSDDNTGIIVNDWIKQNKIKIRYYFQENKGKMEAVNLAHSLINNEICVNIDSDDYLPSNSIEIICREWKSLRFEKKVAGIVGLDIYENGSIVGDRFPYDLKYSTYSNFSKKFRGDKKFVLKTEVLKEFPNYPSISAEKFPAPGYLYLLIDQFYIFKLINKPLCIVEYFEDGLSKNKIFQYKNSPNSFIFYRMEVIRLSNSFIEKLKSSIHLLSSCLFANNYKKAFINYPFFFTISIIPGIMLNILIRLKIHLRNIKINKI